MNSDPIYDELTRLRDEYARRARKTKPSPIQDYYYSRVLRAVSELLGSIHGRSVLDIGCGDGTWLRLFRELGASKLAGIELRDEPCASARRNVPEAELVCASAHHLPWPDAHFDVISQFVVFTSILDWKPEAANSRGNAARSEALRSDPLVRLPHEQSA